MGIYIFMLTNDLLILEILLSLVIVSYITSTNLLMLLYSGGLYLLLLGGLLLLNDVDVYVGFLWVIDLGVGLVFFIFILHFTTFLHQKSQFNLSSRYFFLISNTVLACYIWGYYGFFSNDNSYYRDLAKTWFFRVSHTDYYNILNTHEVTELNLLKNSYFILNSFEFFIVNFSLLFGLLSAILLCFMVHRIFNILNFSQIMNLDLLKASDTSFFIKSQNFISQQNTAGAVKVWSKTPSSYRS